ncbi:MAG TPA: hypothetical protein VFK05_03520, partial [Polyangiaceae bacterium]|nr:hypothetical protein [Polyangiaceae bacterium]
MGVGTLAERSLFSHAPMKTSNDAARPTPALRAVVEPRPTASSPAEPLAAVPVPPTRGALPASSSRERSAVGATPAPPNAPAPLAAVGSEADKTASLSQQARELAELKRLIDSGASSEALRRLEHSPEAASLLTEERDALYVQALARAQRRDEARTAARRFLAHYPHSPYFETIRQLLADP